MAGRGPAPKDPENRARSNAPERGEWLSLPPLGKPILPTLPKPVAGDPFKVWPARTRRLWDAWRADWATGFYSDAEVGMAVELAYLHAYSILDPTAARASEVRQWMDRLGLTPKGKRDLRLRLAVESAAAAPASSSAIESDPTYAGLRVVG